MLRVDVCSIQLQPAQSPSMFRTTNDECFNEENRMTFCNIKLMNNSLTTCIQMLQLNNSLTTCTDVVVEKFSTTCTDVVVLILDCRIIE